MNDATRYLPFDEIDRLPPLEYRIRPLLERHAVLVVGGPPKQGKSRLVLNMLWQAVAGRRVLGRFDTFGVERALLYNAEGGVIGLQARAGMKECVASALHSRIVGTDDRPLLMWPNGTMHGAAWDRLHEQTRKWRAQIVVLDPLISFHAADENNNAHMEQVFQGLDRFATACDCAVIVVHHTKKPAELPATGMGVAPPSGVQLRGASAIHGAATNIIMCAPLRVLAGDKRTVRGFVLGFELKHAEAPDDLVLVCDAVSGRFYPRVRLDAEPAAWLGDPQEWADDWGPDAERYARAFGCTALRARALMGTVDV